VAAFKRGGAAGRGLGEIGIVHAVAGQRAQLEEGRAGIEQAGQALARQQRAACLEGRPGAFRRTGGAALQRAQFVHQRQHGSALRAVGLGGGFDP
jgi:hypothetical protein